MAGAPMSAAPVPIRPPSGLSDSDKEQLVAAGADPERLDDADHLGELVLVAAKALAVEINAHRITKLAALQVMEDREHRCRDAERNARTYHKMYFDLRAATKEATPPPAFSRKSRQ